MKKLYILIALTSLFFVQSCDKFLDLKPENIQVVSTVEDYRDILASYMRLLKTVDGSQKPVLGGYFLYPPFDVASTFAYRSGELTINKNSRSYYDASLGEYKQNAVNLMSWMGTNDNCWNRYYSFLGPINMIIEGIKTADGDDERLRDYVQGEALVWRAYSYFKLLQYFSPYKQDKYGIPVYLKPYEDPGNAMPKRETQTNVYKQILKDCQEALDLMERTPSTTWNCAYNPCFLHGMLASIYCYKAMSAAAEEEDWQNAIDHADKAMTGRTFVRDQATYNAMFDASALQAFTNDEFYLRIVDGANGQIADFSDIYYQTSPTNQANPGPELEFYLLYKDDDVRKNTFFRTQTDGSLVYDKYNLSANPYAIYGIAYGGIVMLFRTAETQLIKAEALYRLGKTTEAKEALNEFKQGRYLDIEGSYTESDLLNEILKERKLEFYHEQDMWWLDMKRIGTRMERVINGTLYVLEPDDYRYCFPIPQSEMKVNKNMIQNPGWDEISL